MRRVAVLAAGGVLAVAAVGFGASKFMSSSAPVANVAAKGDQGELTTGAISARWPKAEADKTSAPAPTVQPASTTPSREAPAPVQASCNVPGAMGISRTVQIDTTGGPGLGLSQYRDYDFLQPSEVVLTFDDGPWPVNTPAVLAALDAQCLKAVFFPVGKHASWHPEILRQVLARGHTVGAHTWSHVNLAIKPVQEAKDEIEKGFSAVVLAAGQPISPFFRFPQLRQTKELTTYLGERNVAAFSIDVDSEDFRIHKPEVLISGVMAKLKKTGKGIILMHDFQKSTAQALPELLRQLQAGGYKVVHMKAKDNFVSLPQYDAAVATLMQSKAGPVRSSNARPTASVIQTVTTN
ncbi:polysaccharide deacetylase family protein [Tardiphaga sp. vice352]|uniref:polysaccharide deacetylase family protein n=1 Tax=unclassified Tardiphaga TaxID=2631404 RepID=UPI001164F371|nr:MULTISPECIES: polysaccharide deacetylase family protein [unclassified Tardiphaga]MBC7583560.1 polysaccharide deacetylase family protein [Tardiphaga sp.]QDM22281.1 polysaccharide deacetylase family protein [Tardiphaga sp. vice154]QDM27543.1 polysaccharide deacetylase family protein [Tardiphaga sp. vice304]QDM32681.1 polysaccharide deacetylase family protein [Tardiphaga sp. vice352]